MKVSACRLSVPCGRQRLPFHSWTLECTNVCAWEKRIFVCRHHYSSRGRAGGRAKCWLWRGRFKQKNLKKQRRSSEENTLAYLVLLFSADFFLMFCGKSRTAPSAQKCHFDFVQYSTWIILTLASFSSPKEMLPPPPSSHPHPEKKRSIFFFPHTTLWQTRVARKQKQYI